MWQEEVRLGKEAGAAAAAAAGELGTLFLGLRKLFLSKGSG